MGGFSGDGGPAVSAQLNGPRGLALDSGGNLFIADFNNNRIRKLDTSGNLTTVAGTGVAASTGDAGPALGATLNNPEGLAVDAVGNLVVHHRAQR